MKTQVAERDNTPQCRSTHVVSLADLLEARAHRNVDPLAFTSHAEDSASAQARECARPCGVPVVDELLGGLVPATVTVVRTSWKEVALALSAEIVVGVARTGRRVLAVCERDARPLVDVLVARAARLTLDRARSLQLGWNPDYIRACGAVVSLPVDVAREPVEPSALSAKPDLVVVTDADQGGTVPGTEALPRYRRLACTLGAPVFVVVTGTAPEWTEIEDAHLELVRTHVGHHSIGLLVRGVVPGRPVDRVLRVMLTRPTARLRVLEEDWPLQTVAPPRSVEPRWVDDAPAPFDAAALGRILEDRAWTAASAREAEDVLLSLAMLALEGTPLPSDDGALPHVISACGGMGRWMRVLATAGMHADRAAWACVERGAVPLDELPENAPAAWRMARRQRRLF